MAGMGVPQHATVRGPEAVSASLPLRARLAPGHAVTLEERLPFRANLVGVLLHAPDAEGLSVQVRGLGRGGWTDWVDAHIDTEDGPNRDLEPGHAGVVNSAPVWLGTADRVQVQIDSDDDARVVRNIRLFAVNTIGDAYARPAPLAFLHAIGRFLTARALPPAEAAPSRPDIITRAQWGADERIRTKGPGIASSLKVAIVHHTAGSNTYAKSESAAVVRGIYSYHVKALDYSDIAYNFLVDRYGQVFEGRWGGIDKPVIGGHTGGMNPYTTGISLMGEFSNVAPPKRMVGALVRILAWKLDVHHVPPIGKVRMTIGDGNSKYGAGQTVKFNRISGHRDASATACPGGYTYSRLSGIRDRVERRGNPKIYLPRRSPSLLLPDGDGVADIARFTAGFSRKVRWRLSIEDAAGTAWRRLKGTGGALDKTWGGRTAGGALVPTGRYTWTLTARRVSNDTWATPAKGLLTVVAPAPRGCAGCSVSADFNGDGFDDLAIGAPGDSPKGVTAAGGVNVLYGGLGGLSASGDDYWRQGIEGLRNSGQVGDGFGYVVAAGDFDADGFADLAIGVPRKDVGGKVDAGAVAILYGSVDGLTAAGNQLLTAARGSIPGDAERGDAFGSALAVGDFDRDGSQDLAIGVPGKDIGDRPDAGQVIVLHGSSSGLTGAGARAWSQAGKAVRGRPGPNDAFGASLAAGNFDSDAADDLAVGVPGKTRGGEARAGMVNVLYGSGQGLTGDKGVRWDQTVLADDPETGDSFGFALAAGDLDGDGRDDLAIGVPGEDVRDRPRAGAVAALKGASAGLVDAWPALLNQDTTEVPNAPQAGDGFGSSLAIGRFGLGLAEDLAIGVPGENIDGVKNAGLVTVMRGSVGGPTGIGSAVWHQQSKFVGGVNERGDVFGAALVTGDFNGDTFGDIAIGAPGEGLGTIQLAGAITVFYGSTDGLAATGRQVWHQDIAGVRGRAQVGDILSAV